MASTEMDMDKQAVFDYIMRALGPKKADVRNGEGPGDILFELKGMTIRVHVASNTCMRIESVRYPRCSTNLSQKEHLLEAADMVCRFAELQRLIAVSYTHLTLPTIA